MGFFRESRGVEVVANRISFRRWLAGYKECPVSGGNLPFATISSIHFCTAGNAYFRPTPDLHRQSANGNYAAEVAVHATRSLLTPPAKIGHHPENNMLVDYFQTILTGHTTVLNKGDYQRRQERYDTY